MYSVKRPNRFVKASWKCKRCWRLWFKFPIGERLIQFGAWLCMIDGEDSPYMVQYSEDTGDILVVGRGRQKFKAATQQYGVSIRHDPQGLNKLFWPLTEPK